MSAPGRTGDYVRGAQRDVARIGTAPDGSAAADIDAFLQRVADAPFDHDLWHVLRWIDARHPGSPRLGRAPQPRWEAVRIGQEPSLAFAPTQLLRCETNVRADGRPLLTILGFGLFGPNGPLPTHLTEYARERLLAHDRALVRFCDMFHHRFTLFFYRAWADAQSTVSLDRPGEDRFGRYVSSLVHLGDDTLRDRDSVPHHAKLFGAGHLVRETRNAEGLQRLLALFFRTRVEVEQWAFQWLALAPEQRTRLGGGRPADQLGVGTVAGASVPDVQGKFRLRIGALSLAGYEQHLPGGSAFPKLLAWLRNYIGLELAWDVRLVLLRDDVPRAQLGTTGRLGWTTWLGARTRSDDADDLVLAPEAIAARPGYRAACHA
jgi:type VI secretion system protein ImpH